MALFKVENNFTTGRTIYRILGLKFSCVNPKLVIRPDYTPVISKIQNKYKNNEKIRVGFYVSENAKWNAEELYKLFEQSEEFEPFVIVSLLSSVHNGKDITRNNLQENYDFFKVNGKNVVKAYNEEKKEYIPLENFNVDIIFYQQPWCIPDIHNLEYTKNFALGCHFHYGLSIFKSKIVDLPFYKKLFIYFINNKFEKKELMKAGYQNLCEIGFPKLDIYKSIQRTKSETEKKTIIYAPHFSYKKNSILRIGTFNKTGIKMLEFAKQHPEYNWVFKPHPALKNELYKDTNYGEKFVETYYSEWEKLGITYEQGNYFELFINSDLMITDCSSFLLEYLPTNQSLFRLERKDSVPLNDFGKNLAKCLYRINDFDCFKKYFKTIMENGIDSLKEQRIKFIKNMLDKETSSEKIANILLKIIKDEVT